MLLLCPVLVTGANEVWGCYGKGGSPLYPNNGFSQGGAPLD
jgi:hypothetical protein